MTLALLLTDYIRAAFSGLYIETHEPDEALREIKELCRRERWVLATWDIDRGLLLPGAQDAGVQSAADPLAAIRSLPALATPDGTALLVLKNFHRFLNSAEVVQALQHQLQAGKAARTFLVIIAPTLQLPIELEKLFVVLEHELPGREQLTDIAREIATDAEDLPKGKELTYLIDAAAGLTRYEAEGAFSLSLARHGRLQPDVIWELKSQTLKKSGLVAAPRRRTLRVTRRAGVAQGILPEGAAAGPVGEAAGHSAAVATRVWQIALLQSARRRDWPTHIDPRHRRPAGFAGGRVRAQHPSGAAHH